MKEETKPSTDNWHWRKLSFLQGWDKEVLVLCCWGLQLAEDVVRTKLRESR